MGPPHQKVSLQLLGACIDLKVRQNGISALMRSALGERIRVFHAKEKSEQWGIKLNFISFLSLESGCSTYLVCVCGLSVLMFNVCMGESV